MISGTIIRTVVMLGLSGTAFAKDRKFTVIVGLVLLIVYSALRVADTLPDTPITEQLW